MDSQNADGSATPGKGRLDDQGFDRTVSESEDDDLDRALANYFPRAPGGLSDAHLRALGWVAAAFGMLETTLFFQITTKAELPPERANVLFGRLQWQPMLDSFSRLVEHDHQGDLLDQYKVWRARATQLAKRRNDAIHAGWIGGQPDARLVRAARTRQGLAGIPVEFSSVEELERLARDAQQLTLDLLELGESLGSTVYES